MVLPLGVEPSKPRLFWDGRYLNLMCTHMPFAMDSVGKVAQCSWFGAHQVTLDHKSGFHHVALDAESWQYFGLCWQGVYYVFTVLCFGWCSSPYIYHTLSSVVGQYLRARDTPVLVWIDDFYLSNFRSTKSGTPQAQFRVAQAATYLALSVFYKAGYFMSASKCVLTPTTRLVFLGVVCDTTLRRFEVPQDKPDKLEQILNGVVETGSIYFATFEKLAGPERQGERESHARYNRAIVLAASGRRFHAGVALGTIVCSEENKEADDLPVETRGGTLCRTREQAFRPVMADVRRSRHGPDGHPGVSPVRTRHGPGTRTAATVLLTVSHQWERRCRCFQPQREPDAWRAETMLWILLPTS